MVGIGDVAGDGAGTGTGSAVAAAASQAMTAGCSGMVGSGRPVEAPRSLGGWWRVGREASASGQEWEQ